MMKERALVGSERKKREGGVGAGWERGAARRPPRVRTPNTQQNMKPKISSARGPGAAELPPTEKQTAVACRWSVVAE